MKKKNLCHRIVTVSTHEMMKKKKRKEGYTYIYIFISLSFVLNVGLIALDHAINLVKFVVSVILPVGLYDEKGGAITYSLPMHLVNTKKELRSDVFRLFLVNFLSHFLFR